MVEPGTKPRSLAHAPTFERAAPQAAHERARGLRACTHKSRLFGNRWLPQMTCADCAGSSGDLLPPSPPAQKANARQVCDYSPHYGRWPSLLQSCSRDCQTGGEIDRLGAGACRGSRRCLRHRISAVGPKIPCTKAVKTARAGPLSGYSGDLPPPSPPGEKATARKDQAGKSCTDDGVYVWRERWSFRTAKTQSGGQAGRNPALQRAPDLILANPLCCHPG